MKNILNKTETKDNNQNSSEIFDSMKHHSYLKNNIKLFIINKEFISSKFQFNKNLPKFYTFIINNYLLSGNINILKIYAINDEYKLVKTLKENINFNNWIIYKKFLILELENNLINIYDIEDNFSKKFQFNKKKFNIDKIIIKNNLLISVFTDKCKIKIYDMKKKFIIKKIIEEKINYFFILIKKNLFLYGDENKFLLEFNLFNTQITLVEHYSDNYEILKNFIKRCNKNKQNFNDFKKFNNTNKNLDKMIEIINNLFKEMEFQNNEKLIFNKDENISDINNNINFFKNKIEFMMKLFFDLSKQFNRVNYKSEVTQKEIKIINKY